MPFKSRKNSATQSELRFRGGEKRHVKSPCANRLEEHARYHDVEASQLYVAPTHCVQVVAALFAFVSKPAAHGRHVPVKGCGAYWPVGHEALRGKWMRV